LVCAFSAPALGGHPWIDEPGDHRDSPSKSPFNSEGEPGETVGNAVADKTSATNSPRSDFVSAAMYEFTFYLYDLLAGNEQTGQSVAPDPKSRE